MKEGDRVQVTRGKHRGKSGTVIYIKEIKNTKMHLVSLEDGLEELLTEGQLKVIPSD